jgi:hypothetical protein
LFIVLDTLYDISVIESSIWHESVTPEQTLSIVCPSSFQPESNVPSDILLRTHTCFGLTPYSVEGLSEHKSFRPLHVYIHTNPDASVGREQKFTYITSTEYIFVKEDQFSEELAFPKHSE